MASYKKYKSVTGIEYNFYVDIDGTEKFVSLNGPGAILIVKDRKLAEAIEKSNFFKNGEIKLVSVVGNVSGETVQDANEIMEEFPDVKNMGDAVEVLTTKYGVKESDIVRKGQIMAKAEELGVRFPNYK